MKKCESVTWCCGPSLGCRSGSSAGEPIVKLPPGIESISKPPPGPTASVKTRAEFLSEGLRTPLWSTVAVSKPMVRSDGFDTSRLIEGAAITRRCRLPQALQPPMLADALAESVVPIIATVAQLGQWPTPQRLA